MGKSSLGTLEKDAARDISYAHAATSRSGRTLIRALENATGRIQLIRRADGYQNEVDAGADFWKVMVKRYGLSLEVQGGNLNDIPKTGPLVLVANHPFGILDGLMMGHILSQVRGGEFRILAHRVFRKADDINRIILPISFDETREATTLNLQTRREAMEFLKNGGAIGVFPGGTVSTSETLLSRPLDPAWRTFTSKMIAKSGATVVPVYFKGQNSRLFQMASHMHPNLRVALLINEFRRRTDAPVQVTLGAPIERQALKALSGDAKAMMDFLRARTYALSEDGHGVDAYGFEFEEKHKRDRGDGGRHFGQRAWRSDRVQSGDRASP